MTDLTEATNYEVEQVTFDGLIDGQDNTDDTEINRWTKTGDRLYINGPAKWEKNSTYFDLEASELVDLPGSRDVTVDVEDDRVTLTVEDHGSLGYDKTWTIVLTFETEDDDEDADESDDDEEAELVTDGGEDKSAHVDDETIEDAIDGELVDDTEEVRDALATMQRSAEESWGHIVDSIEDGYLTVVAESRDLVVLAGKGLEYEPYLAPGDYDDRDTRDAVSAVQHALARQNSDWNWSVTYPLVVRKPAEFKAGQIYVEAVINGMLAEGLSPAEAWAYYGVEIRGNSQSSWARRAGKDQSTINRSVKRAAEKLPR